MTSVPTANWCATRPIADPERSSVVSPTEAGRRLREPGPLRFFGSRFSYAPHLDARGGEALTLRTPEVVAAQDDASVLIAGDCRLTQVWDALRANGRTLPVCPPVITEQTAAGAIGTGTHAQGLAEGLFSDVVEAVELVDGSGEPRWIERGDEEFGAVSLHLGALGLITRMRLEVVPNRRYYCAKYSCTGADLAGGFVATARHAAHAKAWWFPEDDRALVWEVDPLIGHRVPTEESHTDLNPILRAAQQRLARDTHNPDDSAAPQRTVARFLDYSDATGDLTEIFRNGIPAPQINMEVGVPLERFTQAMDDLQRVVAASPFRMHYPVILRPTGPSAAWLAGNYDRPVCWFGFVVYEATDGSVAEGSRELLGEIQSALAAHGGLPHWGKYFDPALFDFTQLPRWADFRELRRRLDPEGRLMSERLARILAPGA